MLYRDVVQNLQQQYFGLFKKALPSINIGLDTIEVVDHGLSNGEANQNFLDCGLGISVRVINQRQGTQAGYTGKFLAWLPHQFMPEHWHTDILAVPKGISMTIKFLRLENIVKDFKGIQGYDNQRYDFFVPQENLINPEDVPENAILILGKDEYFDIIYGEGSFFLPGDKTQNPKYKIPSTQEKYVKHKCEYLLKAGQSLHVRAGTPHSAKAGPKGMIAIEYSMPSRDEADIFSNPNISRFTIIKERNI